MLLGCCCGVALVRCWLVVVVYLRCIVACLLGVVVVGLSLCYFFCVVRLVRCCVVVLLVCRCVDVLFCCCVEVVGLLCVGVVLCCVSSLLRCIVVICCALVWCWCCFVVCIHDCSVLLFLLFRCVVV